MKTTVQYIGQCSKYFTNRYKMKKGKNLGKLFLAVLDDYGIKSKLFCITTDNGSNNGSMAEYIEKVAENDPSFSFNEENMISCFVHVINLVCHNLIEKGLKARAPNDSANMEAVMKDVSII